MKSCYTKIWNVGSWQITAGWSLVCFGLCFLFHCWGDFGGHIVIGPFCFMVDRPQSLARKIKG